MPDHDLRAQQAPPESARPAWNGMPVPPAPSTPPAPVGAAARPAAPATPAVTGMVTFLSSKRRDGPWQVPPHLRVAAILGSVELDLRQATLAPGGSVIEIFALLGSVDIVVPPGIAVDCDGDTVIGTFELRVDHSAVGVGAPPPDAPRLRVTGTAYMGSVSVRVKGPDQPLLARISRSLGIGG